MTVAKPALAQPPAPALYRLGALVLLGGLVVLSWWIFRAAGHDYWTFWLKSGPVIGLATAAFGWAWGGLDRNPGLVSTDPLDYLGACLQVVGLPLDAFGGHLDHENHERPVAVTDTLLVIPLALVFLVAVLAWMVLIAPVQYFAFLVFGAPSRIALASRFRVYARLDGTRLHYRGGTALAPEAHRNDDGWWDASMRDRPVTVASAFMAAALLVIDTLLA
jgi:hypothetical protein